ncbi:DNA-binding transcriptional regulator, MarR family [Variovorax sp. HW608]|uniref:MarR family winged helix-turn-helix transcriptional regulator n=1 Tax=Variovorax sp. HW608 TaxID=1034889 RepID=UPI00081FE75C|nr:MarR family transcriptional regulator [Variovorax sp. HW608]SCK11441.1 DNA-binding transcriptional regulator, MarR family [Variovorax sp. HW608]
MQQGKQPMTVEQCNCFTVRKAARQISRFYDGHLQTTGLRITQFLILATLSELGSAAVSELAERLDVERTAMGKMATVLQRDGLLDIGPAPTDARTKVIKLSRDGRRVFEKALPLWREAQRQFAELNGTARVASIHESLESMVVDESIAVDD